MVGRRWIVLETADLLAFKGTPVKLLLRILPTRR